MTIARRREELKNAIGGDRLAKLNARLDDLLIELTRMEIIYRVSNSRLNKIRENDLLRLAEEQKNLKRQLDEAVSRQVELVVQLPLIRSNSESMTEPRLTVIE